MIQQGLELLCFLTRGLRAILPQGEQDPLCGFLKGQGPPTVLENIYIGLPKCHSWLRVSHGDHHLGPAVGIVPCKGCSLEIGDILVVDIHFPRACLRFQVKHWSLQGRIQNSLLCG